MLQGFLNLLLLVFYCLFWHCKWRVSFFISPNCKQALFHEHLSHFFCDYKQCCDEYPVTISLCMFVILRIADCISQRSLHLNLPIPHALLKM